MKYVLCGILFWLIICMVAFVNRWNGGRTPAREALKVLLWANVLIVVIIAAFGAVFWFRIS